MADADSLKRVLTRMDTLALAFGAMIGWSWVLLTGTWTEQAGTLGTARPDIANQLRYRKSEELLQGIQIVTQSADSGGVKLLTSCPACQQGLAKYEQETGLKTDYIVMELANQLLGSDWQQAFINAIQQGMIEQVLL